MGVIYFLVCVRKHESSLSTNIRTTAGKKHNDIQQNATFWVQHIRALLYDSVVCFLLPKCLFFYQWCCGANFSPFVPKQTKNIQNEPFEPKIWAPDRPTKTQKMYLHRIFLLRMHKHKKMSPWRCSEKTSSIFVLTNTKIDWQKHKQKRKFWFALFGICSRLFFVSQKLSK